MSKRTGNDSFRRRKRCKSWPWRSSLHFVLLALILFAGCQRAGRYPPQESNENEPEPAADQAAAPKVEQRWLWLEPPGQVPGTPIVFVADSSPDWQSLPGFWNALPIAAGRPTLHIGLPPLPASAALAAADRLHVIKIRVPRGLPDPTPFIAPSNPATHEKWLLGKELFFERVIQMPHERRACTWCHQPDHGFTHDFAIGAGERRNCLSLINCVYNRAQFWDGRVETLEETIFRPDNADPDPVAHDWGNIARTIAETSELNRKFAPLFQSAFGIARATQDAVAKSLATYLRTILSGDSLVDRAEREKLRQRDAELTEKHFAAVLDANALEQLGEKSSEEAAQALANGHRLFHGRAGCAQCHNGPLYTNGEFYNIGLEGNDAAQLAGKELGRFQHVPFGLKAARLMGAYRTPTLRALPRTPRYMHNGRFLTLEEVVDYFNHQVDASRNRYIAAELLSAAGQGQRLQLEAQEIDALVKYLQALDGAGADRIVLR